MQSTWRRYRRRLAVLTLTGAGLAALWAARYADPDAFWATFWSNIGSTLALTPLLYYAGRTLDRRITDVERSTSQSVDALSHQVEAVRDDVAARLDDLGDEARRRLNAERERDRATVKAFEEEATFDRLVELFGRARRVRAIAESGVRVSMGRSRGYLNFNVIQPPTIQAPRGTVGRSARIRIWATDAVGARLTPTTIDWHPTDTPIEAMVGVAEALQAANEYPGDIDFDAGAILRRVARTLELATSCRRRGSDHGLEPVIEMPSDHWAITTAGLAEVGGFYRIETQHLQQNWVEAPADADEDEFWDAHWRAVAYHLGEMTCRE